jgi:hypothetical protein
MKIIKLLKLDYLLPLSGPYSEIGNSLLYSLQLALEEINDKNVVIVQETRVLMMKKNLYQQLKTCALRY